LAKRLQAMGKPQYRDGFKLSLHPSALILPFKWRQPRVIFVNSMSDLFHEDVGLDYVRAVFAVMNQCPQHQFQVLTKRPEVARRFAKYLCWSHNIWMGTTVENALVTHRIAILQQIPARVRFLSLEPLLGPIPKMSLQGIHWVIVGGESGPGARPMKPEWVRDIRDHCVSDQIPFFFKQWGGVCKKRLGRTLDGREWDEMPQKETLLMGQDNDRQPTNHLAGRAAYAG
jgi:protein gp37